MPEAPLVPTLATLLVAGLASSLHCVGMCGPLVLGFAAAFRGAGGERGGRGLAVDFAGYHAGRLWTYAVLGLAAGAAGRATRDGALALGWQRPVSFLLAGAVIASGVLLLGILPGVRLDRLAGDCGLSRLGRVSWLAALRDGRGVVPRLLLGAVMGLLPCGLVYAMLALVATFPDPALAAAGMLVFGLGTLPALSAVIMTSRAIPARLRAHGTRLVAIALIASGAWMIVRTVDSAPGPDPAHCHVDLL